MGLIENFEGIEKQKHYVRNSQRTWYSKRDGIKIKRNRIIGRRIKKKNLIRWFKILIRWNK